MTHRAVSPLWVVCAVAGWIAAAGNVPLWRKMSSLDLLTGLQGGLFAMAMLLIVWAGMVVLLGLFAWRFTLKPVATLLLCLRSCRPGWCGANRWHTARCAASCCAVCCSCRWAWWCWRPWCWPVSSLWLRPCATTRKSAI